MKKGKIARLASILVVIALVVTMAGCGGSDNGGGGGDAGSDLKPITLNMSCQDSAESRIGQRLQQWSDEVKEKTDGGLTIKIHFSASLVSPPDTYDAVKSGVADIGWCMTNYAPDQFPITEVVTLPMVGNIDPVQHCSVFWDNYDNVPEIQKEFEPVQLIMAYGNPPNFLSTTKKPIDSLAAASGLSIRTPAGTINDALKSWGMNPINMPISETYDALQKANIDGCNNDWHGTEVFKMYELLNYYSDNMKTFGGVFCTIANKDSWNKLPKEWQDIVMSTGGREGSLAFAEAYREFGEASKQAILAQGGELVVIPDAEIEKFKAETGAIHDAWVQKVSKDGFDGQALLDSTKAAYEKYKEELGL